MRMDRDRPAEGPLVRGFGASGYKVDDAEGRIATVAALLLTPRRADDWSPPALADLTIETITPILDPAPEFVLLGTGASLAHPPHTLVAALEAKGIGLEVMDSRAAARAWGVLRAEGRPIAAALYPLDA